MATNPLPGDAGFNLLREKTAALIQERRDMAELYLNPSLWQKQRSVWETKRLGVTYQYNFVTGQLRINWKASAITDPLKYLYHIIQEPGFAAAEKPEKPVPTSGGTQVFKAWYDYDSLSGAYQQAHNRLPPPKEILEAFIAYDEEEDFLYYADMLDSPRGYDLDADFVLINEVLYAAWRVKSQLVLGNPYGVAKPGEFKEKLPASRERATESVMSFVEAAERALERCNTRANHSNVRRWINLISNELRPGTRRRPIKERKG